VLPAHAESSMHLWKPIAWGFPAQVSPNSLRNRARPTDIGENSPSCVALLDSARSSGGAPPPPADLRRRPRGGSFSAGLPAATSSASDPAKIRGRESPTTAVRDPTSSFGATSSVHTHSSSASPLARICTWAWSAVSSSHPGSRCTSVHRPHTV